MLTAFGGMGLFPANVRRHAGTLCSIPEVLDVLYRPYVGIGPPVIKNKKNVNCCMNITFVSLNIRPLVASDLKSYEL